MAHPDPYLVIDLEMRAVPMPSIGLRRGKDSGWTLLIGGGQGRIIQVRLNDLQVALLAGRCDCAMRDIHASLGCPPPHHPLEPDPDLPWTDDDLIQIPGV